MRRGDGVTIANSGDYGKPRPAIVIQSDAVSERHGSVIVCPLTTWFEDASAFRVTVMPDTRNGLRQPSQAMADKITSIRSNRVGSKIGEIDRDDLGRVSRAVAFVLGLGD